MLKLGIERRVGSMSAVILHCGHSSVQPVRQLCADIPVQVIHWVKRTFFGSGYGIAGYAFPRANMEDYDVGAHGESTERTPEPWPRRKRRFTFLPTSISGSRATDHGRDA
jgi:hypothetical protein